MLYDLSRGLRKISGHPCRICNTDGHLCCLCRSDSQAEGIIAAHFESADVLLIARGSAAQPVFERIQLPADKSQRIDTHLKPITVSHLKNLGS